VVQGVQRVQGERLGLAGHVPKVSRGQPMPPG
jgi:hypothetical protein